MLQLLTRRCRGPALRSRNKTKMHSFHGFLALCLYGRRDVTQSLYQRDGDGLFGGHNCLDDCLETVSVMVSPKDHEMSRSGIRANRHDFPQPLPEGTEIRSCGTCFAWLVGKFTHRGTQHFFQREVTSPAPGVDEMVE